MFRKISPPSTPPLTLTIDGKSVTAERGETVASVMMRQANPSCCHTPVHGSSRAPFCMMGVCFDCLVEVDGAQNVQSCMVEVREGMRVRLPQGARRVETMAAGVVGGKP